ncbi:MAG: peroxiredoxin [Ignavibacteriales bacterium]|nr:peroxiredoxin [Ignavibacteriales bacterium]
MRNILFVLLVFGAVGMVPAQNQGVVLGQKAPDFSLPYATKDSVFRTPLVLEDLIGKAKIVLAFYPADWSPGCTKEVCTFRDNFSALQSLKTEVLGISGDYTWSHHAWARHHDLPFRLLSDHDHKVARRYLSFNEKTQYNRRTVFVIDRKGLIAYMDLEYSVADPDDFGRLRDALSKLP